MPTEVLAHDDGYAIATFGPVFVNVWRSASSLARLSQLRVHEQALVDRTPGGIVVVTLMEGTAFDHPIGGAERAMASEIAKAFASATRASVYIVEGGGFRAAMARGVIAGINLISRPTFPTAVHSDAREGATWLSKHAPDVAVGDVASALEMARAAMRR